MNYGYEDTVTWPEPAKDNLADELARMIRDGDFLDGRGMHPYVEIDCLYPGIRIRRITHLSDERERELIEKADAIYVEHRDRLPASTPQGTTELS